MFYDCFNYLKKQQKLVSLTERRYEWITSHGAATLDPPTCTIVLDDSIDVKREKRARVANIKPSPLDSDISLGR